MGNQIRVVARSQLKSLMREGKVPNLKRECFISIQQTPLNKKRRKNVLIQVKI